MERPSIQKQIWEWLASHATWDITKFFIIAILLVLATSLGGAHLLNTLLRLQPENAVTTANVFLVLLGLIGLLWLFGLLRIPKRAKPEPQDPIFMILVGPGPFLYVDPVPGRIFTIENINILTFNRFSFPIEFSHMQADLFTDDNPLALMAVNIGAQILGNGMNITTLKHSLIDNDAQRARDHRDKHSYCPLLRINGTAYFRMPQGNLLNVPVNGAIRCLIHKG